MTLDSLVVDIEYPTTARLVCGVPPFSCYWPKAENAGGLGAEPPGLLQNRVFDIARVVLVPEMPLRRPRLKLQMPQMKRDMPRFKLQMPHLKLRMARLKPRMPYLKLVLLTD